MMLSMPDDDVAAPDLAPDFGMGTPSPEETSTNPELAAQEARNAPPPPFMPPPESIPSTPGDLEEQTAALKMQARIEAGDEWRDRYNQLRMEEGWGVDLEVYSTVPSIMVATIEVYKASVQWTWRGKDVSGTVVARSPRSWATKEEAVSFLHKLFPNTDTTIIE